MRLLGIDYGEKRIGLALSDETLSMAFPFKVVQNGKTIIEELKKVCDENNVAGVVIGESRDDKGKENEIMIAVRGFADLLQKETELPVSFEQEYLTSVEAHRVSFFEQGRQKGKDIDAAAATLILQRYLDKKNKGR
jgi:putative Holliday junction resolvase